MPGYAFKDVVHEHLKELNAEKPVLEFCLFQTGVFMNYLVYPHVTAKTLFITCIGIDVKEGQAVMVEEGEGYRVYTTIQDVAKVVAAAIDYEGTWPEIGGMVGSRIKPKDLIKLVEKNAGTFSRAQSAPQSFDVSTANAFNLQAVLSRFTPSRKRTSLRESSTLRGFHQSTTLICHLQ